jgi:hypothetical protein
MNDHSEDNRSLEDSDRRFWCKINFDESNKSPENHPKGVNIAIAELKQSVNIVSCSPLLKHGS